MTAFDRIKANFAKVFSGQLMISALSFATLAINTNALGLTAFGLLVIIQSVTELALGTCSFKTWAAMTRFGAEDLAAHAVGRLKRRYAVGLALDFGASLTAGAISALIFALFGGVFGLPDGEGALGLAYAVGAAFHATNASIGILRLTHRFGIAMAIQVGHAALLLAVALGLARVDAPLMGYIIGISAARLALVGSLMAAALIALSKLNAPSAGEPARSINVGQFIRYAAAIGVGGTLNRLRQRGEVLIVAALLGPQGAAMFGVAARVISPMGRFAEAVQQSVYPELSRLVAAREQGQARAIVRRISRGTFIVSIALFVGVAALGQPILQNIFGEAFSAAYLPLLWLAAGQLAVSLNAPLSVYYQIAEGAGPYLRISVSASLPFAATALFGPMLFGLAGAGAGTLAYAWVLYVLLKRNLPRDPGQRVDLLATVQRLAWRRA